MGAAAEAVEGYLEEFSFTERLHPRDRLGKFRKTLKPFRPDAKQSQASVGEGRRGEKAGRVAAEVFKMPQADLDRLDTEDLDAVERAIHEVPIITSHFRQKLREKVAHARVSGPTERAATARGDYEGAANAHVHGMTDKQIADLPDADLFRELARWQKFPADVYQNLNQFQRLNSEARRRRLRTT